MPQAEIPSNPILDVALEYLDQGVSVIPVRRSDKRPYIKWEEYQRRLPTREEVESWWARWPEANVAIVCGKISGIYCVDGDGPAGKDWIAANLPPTPVYSLTSRGVHAIFAIPENAVIRNRVKLAPEVDIRGEGGYFVAPPSVHESGHVYQWVLGPDAWENLPVYAPPALHRSDDGKGNLNVDLSGVKSSPLLFNVAMGQRNDALVQLVGKWFGQGMPYDEALWFAKSWNQGNLPPLGEQELTRSVKSIWEAEQRKRQQESAVTVDVPTGNQAESPFPGDLLRPGGLLEDLMEYIDANSPVSIAPFNLAASLALVGSLVGQKVMTETGLRTNLMCICLGYSGVGKNAPHNALSELLVRSSAHSIMGPTTVTSDSSLLKRLSSPGEEVTFMLLDEFGHVLKGIKKPLSVEAKIPALLTKLFSGTTRGESKDYASGEKLLVIWHHVSLYATSTPGRFWEDLSSGDFADGFLARANIFESQDGARDARPIASVSPPEALINSVNELYGLELQWEEIQGNLANAIYRRPAPRPVRTSPSARELFEPWRTR
jgi:hypothetical protein